MASHTIVCGRNVEIAIQQSAIMQSFQIVHEANLDPVLIGENAPKSSRLFENQVFHMVELMN